MEDLVKVVIEVELRGEGGLTKERAVAAIERALELRVEQDVKSGRRFGLSFRAALIDAIEEEAAEDFTDVVSMTPKAVG